MDRIAIKQGIDAGLQQNTIAANLGFSPSAISREINRNTGRRGYRPMQAQAVTDSRQQFRKQPRKMNSKLKTTIRKLLKKKWSPQQISCRLKKENNSEISHETIYKWVYQERLKGDKLWTHLRRSHRKRRPRIPRENRKKGQLKDMTPIEKRGNGANNRSRRGHWERDTMIGIKTGSSLLVLADRKTRLVLATKLKDRKSQRVSDATIKLIKN